MAPPPAKSAGVSKKTSPKSIGASSAAAAPPPSPQATQPMVDPENPKGYVLSPGEGWQRLTSDGRFKSVGQVTCAGHNLKAWLKLRQSRKDGSGSFSALSAACWQESMPCKNVLGDAIEAGKDVWFCPGDAGEGVEPYLVAFPVGIQPFDYKKKGKELKRTLTPNISYTPQRIRNNDTGDLLWSATDQPSLQPDFVFIDQ